MREEFITLAHGSGGAETGALFESVFAKYFKNEILARLEDSAVLPDLKNCGLAVSTDSYVVKPLVFPGGDIGKLAVCGTVNDVLMSGAVPKWLTCGFIIEAGLPVSLLDGVCASMAKAASEAGVTIIAGDTKVIEGKEREGGLIINTTGIGIIKTGTVLPKPSGIRPGDVIIVSGNLGDHHAAILSSRMGIKNIIKSDCALLSPIVDSLTNTGVEIHAMRDVTRGGLGTVLNELARSSGVLIEIDEKALPVNPEVRSFCGIIGLDPVYMGNEGKMVLAVEKEVADRALALIKETEVGKDAAVIGTAAGKIGSIPVSPSVIMTTRIGGRVRIDVLYGEGLPRIC